MRLRPLTEAECYARCYGGRHDESVSLLSEETALDQAITALTQGRGDLAPSGDSRKAREAA